MAVLVVFPQAYIDQQRVEFHFGTSTQSHLIMATVSAQVGPEIRRFTKAATNPERALGDLREAVEVAQREASAA